MRRRLALAGRLLAAEGVRSVAERLVDRVRERRWRGAFRPHDGARPLPAHLSAAALHVLATPPAPRLGGVEAQLLLRLEAASAQEPVALLHGEQDGSIRLLVWRGRERYAVAMSSAGEAAAPAGDGRWGTAARRTAALTGARLLHVESPAGLPLPELTALAGSFPLVLGLHDFALFCVRPHLLEVPAGRFCHFCREPDRCRRCLAAAGEASSAEDLERRRSEAVRLLAAASAVVFPSPYLRDEHRRLYPGSRRDEVVAPGIAPTALPSRRERAGRPLVAFVGGGRPHKGADDFAGLVEAARSAAGLSGVDWLVLGGGGEDALRRLRRLPGVRVAGYYRFGSLPARLRREGVSAALLLPAVPESFSLALSECLAADVPVVAWARGALGPRLAEGGGLAVAPEAGGGELARALAAVLAGAAPAPPPAPTAAAAAAAIRVLHGELLAASPPSVRA